MKEDDKRTTGEQRNDTGTASSESTVASRFSPTPPTSPGSGEITLSDDERLVAHAVEVAWRGRWNFSLDEIGAKLAFCKSFNVYPELFGKTHAGSPDCTVNEWKINVRAAAPGPDAGLMLPCDEACDDVDVYVLMVGRFPTYRSAGWMSRDEVMKDEYLTQANR